MKKRPDKETALVYNRAKSIEHVAEEASGEHALNPASYKTPLTHLSIRVLKRSERRMVQEWHIGELMAPTDDMLPLDSTYVVTQDEKPVLSVTLYLTNSPEFCMVDNLIASPFLQKDERRVLITYLLEHISSVARHQGYKKLFCMALYEGLAKRYQELGFTRTGTVATFLKEL